MAKHTSGLQCSESTAPTSAMWVNTIRPQHMPPRPIPSVIVTQCNMPLTCGHFWDLYRGSILINDLIYFSTAIFLLCQPILIVQDVGVHI